MARTKYTFEKRQKEIARQKKQAEKAQRKAEAKKKLSDGESEDLVDSETEVDRQPPEES